MYSRPVVKKLSTAIAAVALIGTPAFAADMAVKDRLVRRRAELYVLLIWLKSCCNNSGNFASGGPDMLLALINVLVIVVVGAICFYLIDRFVRDGRLGNLLKILVALICLAAIVQRVLPVLGVSF
jgi:hypothetical protein